MKLTKMGRTRHLVNRELLGPRPIVVDAGASYGEFCTEWMKRIGKGRVISLEPARNCYNIFQTVHPTIEIRMVALGSPPRKATFTEFIGKNGKFHQWGNLYDRGVLRAKKKKSCQRILRYDVEIIDPGMLLSELGRIDYLKMDIEGAESEVVAWLFKNPQADILQLSFENHNATMLGHHKKALAKAGYTVTVRGDEVYAAR